MKTPKSRRSFGIIILLTWLAAPVVEYVYYSVELSRGSFPPEADSISIPIFQFIIGWLVTSPVVAGIGYWILKRYTPGVPITAWNKKRPVWSSVITGLFLLFLLLEAKFLAHALGKLDIVDIGYTAVVITVAALARATVVAHNMT